MKKLIYTLLAFATVCFSCVQDVDDVYDKPVAQRVEEAVQEYHDLLVSSEHGRSEERRVGKVWRAGGSATR